MLPARTPFLNREQSLPGSNQTNKKLRIRSVLFYANSVLNMYIHIRRIYTDVYPFYVCISYQQAVYLQVIPRIIYT